MTEERHGSSVASHRVPEVVESVVEEVVAPAAPGAPPTSAAPVDVEAVSPDARSGLALPFVVAGGALVVLVAVSAAVTSEASWLLQADERLHAFALEHRGPVDLELARAITWAGATTVALPVVAVVGALAVRGHLPWRSRVGAGALLAAVASTGVYAGLLLNAWADRPRPPMQDWAGAAGGPAFPSGHTTMGTLLAACCAWALTSRVPSTTGRVLLWTGAALVALGVGWSRVWLGVHWPSDVVGGWAFGIAWASLSALAVTAWRRRRTPV